MKLAKTFSRNKIGFGMIIAVPYKGLGWSSHPEIAFFGLCPVLCDNSS
jgi:hypothetical protein